MTIPSPKRILIVDDEPLLLELVGKILTAAGYEVTQTVSPHEALRLIEHTDFSLVVSDVRMPTLSGPDLTRRMRFENAPKVLFMSGASSRSIDELTRSGASFLKKPFRNRELLTAVRSLVGA